MTLRFDDQICFPFLPRISRSRNDEDPSVGHKPENFHDCLILISLMDLNLYC